MDKIQVIDNSLRPAEKEINMISISFRKLCNNNEWKARSAIKGFTNETKYKQMILQQQAEAKNGFVSFTRGRDLQATA